MVLNSSGVAETAAASRSNRSVDRAERVLMLDPVKASEFEEPIVLDQTATHLCVSSPDGQPSEMIVIERTSEGWRLLTHGADCRLNGEPADDALLQMGDTLMLSTTQFRVRHATTDELLNYLPQSGGGDQATRITDPDLDVAARERDLADWERNLAECEADLRIRQQVFEGESPEETISPAGRRNETNRAETRPLEGLAALRTDRAEHDADQKRIKEWLEQLKEQRASLGKEREDLAAARAALTQEERAQEERAGESAALRSGDPKVETMARRLAATLAAGIDGGARLLPGEELRSPRLTPQEARARLNSLRDFANQSTRQTLSQHFWRKHRSAIVLKAALVAMSFALAGVLYANHGVLGSPMSAFAWGAAAIGLITTSGLLHTWTEINRLNGRSRPVAIELHSEPEAAANETLASRTP